jgi:acyl-CoA thioesterase
MSSTSLRDVAGVDRVASGTYLAHPTDNYTVMGRPNGGYLQCVMASAALAEAAVHGSAHTHALAVSTNYVNPPELAPVEATVDIRRIGKSATFAHVTVRQEGHVTTESVVTLGTIGTRSEPRYVATAVSDLPPLESLERLNAAGVGIHSVLDMRLDPATTGYARGELSDQAEFRGWLRLADGDQPWNAWSLLFASDAFPPATFPVGSSGWVPTLQLSSYIRREPIGEWLRVRQWCTQIDDGVVDERCEIFDEAGYLVASSVQLALVRFPER